MNVTRGPVCLAVRIQAAGTIQRWTVVGLTARSKYGECIFAAHFMATSAEEAREQAFGAFLDFRARLEVVVCTAADGVTEVFCLGSDLAQREGDLECSNSPSTT
jgi:hypothetical protein